MCSWRVQVLDELCSGMKAAVLQSVTANGAHVKHSAFKQTSDNLTSGY
jgi:hypothetical protein